jgi:hypothetical protein
VRGIHAIESTPLRGVDLNRLTEYEDAARTRVSRFKRPDSEAGRRGSGGNEWKYQGAKQTPDIPKKAHTRPPSENQLFQRLTQITAAPDCTALCTALM